MESEITSELVQRRNKLMNEVASLRKKVPRTLIALEEKIQKKKLKTLIIKKYSPEAIQDQLERYIEGNPACGERRVPNWINDLKSVKAAVAKVEKVNALLQEREKNSIDITVLIKKSLEAQERLHHFNVARKQFANENPLITRSRLEGYNHMISLKANQEEKENLDVEVQQS